MKRLIKSKIFIAVITTIIVASGTLYAANKYQASEVVYNKKDGTTISVQDALNNLYDDINVNNLQEIYTFKESYEDRLARTYAYTINRGKYYFFIDGASIGGSSGRWVGEAPQYTITIANGTVNKITKNLYVLEASEDNTIVNIEYDFGTTWIGAGEYVYYAFYK